MAPGQRRSAKTPAQEAASKDEVKPNGVISHSPLYYVNGQVDTRPEPFRVAGGVEWVVSDHEGFEGFAILVRTAITVAEQRALVDKHNYIVGPFTKEYDATPVAERTVTPRDKEKELVAPYILGWNAAAPDSETGEWKETPPPAEVGASAFDNITEEMLTWLLRISLVGYLVTGKARKSLPKSRPTGDTFVEAEVTTESTG